MGGGGGGGLGDYWRERIFLKFFRQREAINRGTTIIGGNTGFIYY